MKKKTRNLILSIVITLVLLLTFTVTYAVFSYRQTGTNNSQLVLGDIYMHYKESTSNINIENMMPINIEDYIYGNELYKCVSYFQVTKGWTLDSSYGDTTFEDYCRGTGTEYGNTFQGDWNGWMASNADYSEYLIENNIMILDGESYIVNPDMAIQISNPKIEGLPYFEFTISGKNTYTEKDIYYEVLLSHGDAHEDKYTRIRDDLLRFSLVKIDGEYETSLFNNYVYSDLTSQKIWVETIEKNTLTEINNTYRLYMWIDAGTTICSGEITENCHYYTDSDTNNWSDVFASIKVKVNGDFLEKDDYCSSDLTITDGSEFREFVNNCKVDTRIIDANQTIYLSGNNEDVDYNYVWYSGKLWRITSINPDGTLKLITDELVTSINWGSRPTVSRSDITSAYPTSYIREWLNQEFLPTLYNYKNIIIENTKWDATTLNNSVPRTIVNDSVGLLSNYEYIKSYQLTSYDSSYLLNGYWWWTITPLDSAFVRIIRGNTYHYSTMDYSNTPQYHYGVRPSIVLKLDTKFIDGSGIEEDPFILLGDSPSISENQTLLNTRISGEYVKIENDTETDRVFRIVSTENINGNLTTKLVTDDYVKDTNDLDGDEDTTEVLIKTFSSAKEYVLWSEIDVADETYWKGYLNNTWLKELDSSYDETTGESNILEQGIYYLGYQNTSYKTTVCNAVENYNTVAECISDGNVVDNTWTGYVGLLRYSEMFATQSRKYTYDNSSSYWLITPTNGTDMRFVDNNARLYFDHDPSSYSYAARPTIHLKSEIVIKSGSGTEQDPFLVGLPEEE